MLLFLSNSLLIGFLLINPILTGVALLSFIKSRVNDAVHGVAFLSISLLTGFLLNNWLYFLSALIFGYAVGVPIAFIITFLSSLLIICFVKKESIALTPPKQLVYFVTFWLLLLLPLFQSRMLQVKNGAWHSGGGSWADLALHSTFINSFAQQTTVSLRNPIYSQTETTYPFMVNFYSSLLVRYGIPIQEALLIPSIFLLSLMLVLLFYCSLESCRATVAPWIASLLVFCSGGAGALLAWPTVVTSTGKVLGALPIDYTNISEKGFFWTNIITTYLLPQRGFLVGLTTYLAIVFILIRVVKMPNTSLLTLAGFLIGLLPLHHTHSFLTALGLFLGTSAWLLLTKKISFKQMLIPLGVIAVVASPQLWWQFSHSSSSQLPKIHLGWMNDSKTSLSIFWLKNMGIFPPIFLLSSLYLFIKRISAPLKVLSTLSLISFILCNVVIFQPNAWDNMKFMLLNYIILTLVVTKGILTIGSRNIFMRIIAVTLVFSMCASGALSIAREHQTIWPIASIHDLQLAQLVKNKTNPTDIFLTADNHNHPIPMVAGRSVVMGYRGWLWTHGFNYRKTELAIKSIYTGQENALELINEYNIDYVVVGPLEKSQYTVDESFFQKHFSQVIDTGSTQIYAVY
jgi:hypothetical protein